MFEFYAMNLSKERLNCRLFVDVYEEGTKKVHKQSRYNIDSFYEAFTSFDENFDAPNLKINHFEVFVQFQ